MAARELFRAVRDDDRETVGRLLGADPALAGARNAKQLSAVLYALYHGRKEVVELLLAAGPQLDVFDAAAAGQTKPLAELLDANPSLLNAYSADGFTSLHLAVFFRRPEVTRLLLDRGAEVNLVSRNDMRVMPLHSAIAGRDTESSRLLVEHGADVNAASHEGWRPLHGAADHGDATLVQLLLAAGADPNARTDAGETPADTAARAGHAQLAELLRSGAATTA